MVGEDFRLKWNDHHSVFFSSAEQLCRGDHLTDVTLSCGNREFSAHKLVLSVCSAYFSQLFTPKSPSSRVQNLAAIVYLKDVDPRHMELLLSYMYRGEIHVEEQELMGLLATAKGLQIRGLTDAEPEAKEVNQEVTTAGHKRSAKGGRRKSEDAKKFKEEPSPPSQQWQEPNTSNNTTFHDDDEQYNSQQNQELDGLDNIHMPGGEGPMIYEDQNASSTFAMESKPKAKSLLPKKKESTTCEYCYRAFKNTFLLKRHTLVHTGEKPFSCKLCGKDFGRKDTLKDHCRKVHMKKGKQLIKNPVTTEPTSEEDQPIPDQPEFPDCKEEPKI